jgi:MFS family permease
MRALVLGRAVDRYGETRVMRAGAICLAVGLFSIPLPTFALGTVAAMTLVPVGTALLFPSLSALVSHRAPRAEIGQTLGVQQSFGGMARVIAPLWATAVLEIDLALPFFISALVVAFVTVLAFSVKPRVVLSEAA